MLRSLMMMVTRRYRFSAAHRLHSPALSAEDNRAVYGKCNNPLGHGHDYLLEVSVRGPVDEGTGRVVDPACLDELVRVRVLAALDHHNLNAQLTDLEGQPPTTENLARIAWRRLQDAWAGTFPSGPRLARIRLEETRRNSFEMMEEGEE
ncbi:MAG: 6-carboxytetrahydropterin synthase [Bryobacteraceae bacterium]